MTLTPFTPTVADNPVLILPQDVRVHYPSDDDEPMADNKLQYIAIVYAVFALETHLDRWLRAAAIRGNCALYYNPDNHNDYIAPDVLLAYDVDLPDLEGYAPWVHGKPPDLVMEIASPSTYRQDMGIKKQRYEEMGIAEYWQYDPHHRYLPQALIGWQLREGRYEAVPLWDDPLRGARIGTSQVLGTDWGLDLATGTLRLWNEETQDWYRTDKETEAARAREAAQAKQEATRADQEAARAKQEATRADQEATRADQEAARADQAEARARQAEAELARLRAQRKE